MAGVRDRAWACLFRAVSRCSESDLAARPGERGLLTADGCWRRTTPCGPRVLVGRLVYEVRLVGGAHPMMDEGGWRGRVKRRTGGRRFWMALCIVRARVRPSVRPSLRPPCSSLPAHPLYACQSSVCIQDCVVRSRECVCACGCGCICMRLPAYDFLHLRTSVCAHGWARVACLCPGRCWSSWACTPMPTPRVPPVLCLLPASAVAAGRLAQYRVESTHA